MRNTISPLPLPSLALVASLACTACTSSTTSSNLDAGTDAGQNPTFTAVYTKVISGKCSPCHTTAAGEGTDTGHLDMTSQAKAFTNLVGVQAAGSECAGKGVRVTPNNPDKSIMYLKVSLDDPSPCGEKMPRGRAPLDKDDVDLIEAWINGGAQNN